METVKYDGRYEITITITECEDKYIVKKEYEPCIQLKIYEHLEKDTHKKIEIKHFYKDDEVDMSLYNSELSEFYERN